MDHDESLYVPYCAQLLWHGNHFLSGSAIYFLPVGGIVMKHLE